MHFYSITHHELYGGQSPSDDSVRAHCRRLIVSGKATQFFFSVYSFSIGFKALATLGKMSFALSLQFGIALETAHQSSPWWGSASTHRCITLSCWAWERRKATYEYKHSFEIHCKPFSLTWNLELEIGLRFEHVEVNYLQQNEVCNLHLRLFRSRQGENFP